MIERFNFEGLVCDTGYIGGGGGNRQNRGPDLCQYPLCVLKGNLTA